MSSRDDPRFARIAKACREANIPFPEQLAKQFDRVAKKLEGDWGKPAAAEYLQDLIFPSRPGRQGFPPEVAEEILALKNLHEARYRYYIDSVWDPFEAIYKDTSGNKKESDPTQTDTQSGRTSIYRTRGPAQTGSHVAQSYATGEQYSPVIAQLLPKSVHNMLASVRAARDLSGSTVTLPVPETELDELLLDAESLLEENHFNSGTAILEQITTLFPDESPFAYLRLMEVYHLIERREDFDWVSQRLSEEFNCEKVEWESDHSTLRANLEHIVESFLIARRQ